MAKYEKMYHIMFNAAQDAQRVAESHLRETIDSPCIQEMLRVLMKAQAQCEEIYIEE